MKYQVEFIPEAADDYRNLDGSIRKLAANKIEELSDNPYIGENLGNKLNIDLTGFYKLYFNNKKHRIVYRILSNEIEIIEVWGIGKRDKEEIYKLVGKRLRKRL